ncbi:hypothetical protein ISCGN_006289, partial [Ixodes scapularis]
LPLACVIFGCILPSTAVSNTTDLGPVIVTPPSYPRELFPPPLLCTSHLHFRTVTTPEADVSSSGCAVACLQILSAGRSRVKWAREIFCECHARPHYVPLVAAPARMRDLWLHPSFDCRQQHHGSWPCHRYATKLSTGAVSTAAAVHKPSAFPHRHYP